MSVIVEDSLPASLASRLTEEQRQRAVQEMNAANVAQLPDDD